MPNIGMVVPWSLSGILVIVIIVIFLNPEKAQLWSSWVQGWFASLHSFFDRNAISGRIQGTVNQFTKTFDKEAHGIMPYTIKINWVKDIDKEAFLKEDGTVVVRLGYSHGRLEKSLVLAMMAFCNKALVPLARPYVGEKLLRALVLYTTRKMLHTTRNRGSMDYFLNDVYMPEIQADISLQERCQTMETLDHRGIYTRIFLRELEELGRKLYPSIPNESTTLECDNFVLFLKQIAEKAPDEDVELTFTSDEMHVNIILVARHEKIERQGYQPYLRRIEKSRKEGIVTAYLCGLAGNVYSTKAIANIAEKNGWATIVSSENHTVRSKTGRPTVAVCIALDLTHDING